MADRSWSPEELSAPRQGFPRVSSATQSSRDEDRLSILYREREDQLRNGRVDPALDKEITLQERKSGTSAPKLTPVSQQAASAPSKGPIDPSRRSWSPEELTGTPTTQESTKSSGGGFLEAFGKAASPELPGWAQGITDFLGSAPGAVGGTVLALGDMARGTKPSIALQGVMGAMEEMNPFNLIPGKEGRRQGAAYETSPGTIVGHAAGKALEGYGKMAGWTSALTGMGTPEELDAGAQIGLLATLPFMRGQGQAPNTPGAYRQMAQAKSTPQQIAQSKRSQASYLPDRLRAFQEQNPTVEPASPRFRSNQNVEEGRHFEQENRLNIPDRTNQRVRPADELARPDEMLGRPTSDTTLLPRSVKAQEDVMSQRVEGLQEPWAPMEEIMRQDPEWQQRILQDQLGNDIPSMPRQGGSMDFKTGTSLEDAVRSRQQAHDAKVQDLITRADQQRESLPFRGPGRGQRGAFDPEMLVALKRKLETSLRNVQAEHILGKIPKSFIEKREADLKAQLADVKKQIDEGMNQPRDPFKGPGRGQAGAVKLPGGNWAPAAIRETVDKLLRKYTGEHERHPSTMYKERETPVSDERILSFAEIALRDPNHPNHAQAQRFVSMMKGYFNRYFGTNKDPLNNVMIQNHGRNPRGWGDEGQPEVIRWEDMTDQLISSRSNFERPVKKDNIVTESYEPEYHLGYTEHSGAPGLRPYELNQLASKGTRDEYAAARQQFFSYLDHIADYLTQNVTPEELSKYDFVRAVKETAKQDEIMAKKMEQASNSSIEGLPIHKTYPNGFKWVQLKVPEKLTPEQQKSIKELPEGTTVDPRTNDRYVVLGADGKPVKSNGSFGGIASGRTPEEAHFARLVIEEGNSMGHSVGGYAHAGHYGLGGLDAIIAGHAKVYSLRDSKGRSHTTIEVSHDLNYGPRIKQIKGKGNSAPKSEYLPYIQDFVKGGEWERVGDLHNTGLKKFDNEYLTNEEVKQRAEPFYKSLDEIKDQNYPNGIRENYPPIEHFIEKTENYPDLAREIKQWEKDQPKDPFKGPGRNQAGAINISRDDLARLFRTDPAKAAIELAKSSTFDQFERELVNQLGEEARSYAQQVYQQAKGQSTAVTTTGQAPQGTSRSYVPVTTSRTGSSLAGRTLNDFNTWDRRDGATALADFQEGWRNGSLKDLKRDKLMKQGQSRGRQHPMMKWVWDRADWAEREVNMAVADLLYGWNFAQKSWLPILRSTAFRKAKRVGDPDSMMYEWNRLKEDGKEQLLDAFQKFNGEKNPTQADLAAEGLNPSQIRSYENMRRGLERAWDEFLVPAAAKVGITLPEKLPGYVPMMWFGDYRIWGKNRETGAYDFVYGVSSARQAAKAIEEMNRRFGDKWEFSPQDITNTHSEFHATADAFVDAIRLMGNNSPEGKLLLSAMNELMARQGASRHRLSRNEQGTTGYAGQLEEGRSYDPRNLFRKNRLINFERSIEAYVKGLVRYSKNKELIFDLEKVLKNEEMQENFRVAVSSSENLLDSFFGRDKFVDTAVKEFMLERGLPTRLPENFIAGAASWLMYMKVMSWRMPFYFAQSVQDVFIVPRMLMQKSMGTEASINKAVFQGFFDWMGLADAKDVQWLVKYGIVEPKFSENVLLMPSLRGNSPLKFNYRDVVNFVSGNSLAATIDSSVRLRSALILKRFFENSGMDPQSAMEAAAKNSLDVMVEYEGWKRSRMYADLGMAGGIASPLTTFLNNIWNRFGDAMGQMIKGNEHKATDMTLGKDGVYSTKKKRSALPFLALYGVFATLAGLSGLPGRGEWNAIADIVNGVTGSSIPTADDQLIKLSKALRDNELSHDAAIFGPPSAGLGYNFSGTLGAPETIGALLPFMGDPLPRTIGQGLYYGGKVAAQALTGGTPRDSDVYNALKQAVPTAPGHAVLEGAYSPSNINSDRPSWMPQDHDSVVPDKNMNARFSRTPTEQAARFLGLKSNQEALYDMERYRTNRDKFRMQTRRSDAIAVAADRIIDPRGDSSEIIEKQAKKFVENGGDQKRWANTVIKELYERTNTETSRELRSALKAKNPRSLMLLEKHGLIEGERSGFQKQNFDPFKDFEKQWDGIQRRMEGAGPADEVIREYPNPNDARIKDFGKRRRTIEEEDKYPIPQKYKRKKGTSI